MKKIKICVSGKYDNYNDIAYQSEFTYTDREPRKGDLALIHDTLDEYYHTINKLEPDISSRDKASGYNFYECIYTDCDGQECIDLLFTDEREAIL